LFLFYHNAVYRASIAALSQYDFPHPYPAQSSSNVFIWSLFDIREPKEPSLFLVTPPCFPVQSTSPDPIRYKIWDKEYMPLLTGLPLWTRDELVQGLQYQAKYRSLLNALHKFCKSSSPNLSDPLNVYPGARALVREHHSEEDTVQPSPEDALDHLLDATIDRFGYSARDVFDAVFDYSRMTQLHKGAFKFRHQIHGIARCCSIRPL